MADWEVRLASGRSGYDALLVQTPAGEHVVEEYGPNAYVAPLDIVRGVTLSDLAHLLRQRPWQLEIARDAEEWFDIDISERVLTISPAGRRFELEFIYVDEAPLSGEDDESASRRLSSYISPLVKAQRASVVSVDLHEGA